MSARDELYLFAMVGKVQEDGNRQMTVRKLDAYRDELLAEAKLSAALAEEDYQRVVRAASRLEETLRARIAELESLKMAAVSGSTAGDEQPETAVEFGVRAQDGDVLTPTFDRAEAEVRLARYRTMHPTAALMQRTVRYGAWTEVAS